MAFLKDPYGWNSVDVWENDGLFRYGRVVDVAEQGQGWIVDLGCVDRRRELFPYSSVFATYECRKVGDRLNIYRDRSRQKPDRHPVEVLLREHKSGPWIWWPASMLHWTGSLRDELNNYRWLEWCTADGVKQTGIFPCRNIREAYAEWRHRLVRLQRRGKPLRLRCCSDDEPVTVATLLSCIPEGMFERRRMPLPDRYSAIPKSKLLNVIAECIRSQNYHFNNDFSWCAAPGDVIGNCLIYAEHQKQAHQWVNLLTREVLERRIDYYIENETEKLNVQQNPVQTDPTESLAAEICGISSFPAVLLAEIFSCLDTTVQAQLRKICGYWTSVLDLQISRIIRISENPFTFPEDDFDDSGYVVVAPIFNHLSSTTERIVMAYGAPYIIRDLAHDEWHEGEFFTALAMIQHVSLSGTAVNLKSLTMVGMEWAMLFGKKDTEYGSCSNSLLLGAFIQRCKILQTLPCKALKFFRCIVSLCFVFPDDNYERIQLIANIFDAKIDLSIGEFGSAFWNVLESSVCAPDIGKVQMLKDWLRWVVAHQDMENDHSPPPWSRLSDNRPRRLFRIVQKILREIQSSDPRSPAHQRNSKWCLDDVRHLDTHSLSRITIRVLIELADENPEKDTSVTSIANAESCGSYSRTPSP